MIICCYYYWQEINCLNNSLFVCNRIVYCEWVRNNHSALVAHQVGTGLLVLLCVFFVLFFFLFYLWKCVPNVSAILFYSSMVWMWGELSFNMDVVMLKNVYFYLHLHLLFVCISAPFNFYFMLQWKAEAVERMNFFFFLPCII